MRSAHWDGEELTFGPGAHRVAMRPPRTRRGAWRTYYQNIFNPARLKVKAMQAEMPKKYWRNLPEASLIPGYDRRSGEGRDGHDCQDADDAGAASRQDPGQTLARAPAGRRADDASTRRFHCRTARERRRLPPLPALARRDPDRVRRRTEDARVVFVGEQPGDQEDIAGKPFVGPAGKVFDAILDEAGIDRLKVYVTNAVKHFKFEPRGKRRIHAKPNAGEVQACRWWLDKELASSSRTSSWRSAQPPRSRCSASRSPITKMRGQTVEREDGLKVFITIHPSFILRIREPDDKAAERARFLADMKAVRKLAFA